MGSNILEKIRHGEYPETSPTLEEVLCSVGRQLGFRLEKIIDLLENAGIVIPPVGAPGYAITPTGQMIALMRLLAASFPRDLIVVNVTIAATPLVVNPNDFDVPVIITNLDNAQLLHYGSAATMTIQSPIIQTETSEKLLVSASRTLYGIVAGPAAIAVGVSHLDIPIV